jgi:hypothetical protein
VDIKDMGQESIDKNPSEDRKQWWDSVNRVIKFRSHEMLGIVVAN